MARPQSQARDRLTGSTEWFEFDGTAEERSLWNGQATVEEYVAHTPSGVVHGLALRLYNPIARQWTIHWSSSATGVLDAPLTGEFRDGRGAFYGHDTHAGRAVLVRLFWTHEGPDACRWEQALSADGGTTWETNWIMEFTRVA